jgi:AraC-like DNA-binding protein
MKAQILQHFLLPPFEDKLNFYKGGLILNKRDQLHFDHRHNYSFSLVIGGEGHYKVDCHSHHHLRAGSSFSLLPGSHYSFGPQQTWDEYFIVFDGPLAEQWLQQGLLNASDPPIHLRQYQKVEELFKGLMDCENMNSRWKSQRAVNILEQMLIERAIQSEDRPKELSQSTQDFLEHCRKSLETTPDFEGFARKQKLSYSLLRKRFKEETGFSMKRYWQNLRLREAERLLSNSSVSIAQVANEMGFNDVYSFSRAFKNWCGYSPSEQRNRSPFT